MERMARSTLGEGEEDDGGSLTSISRLYFLGFHQLAQA